jgi:small subunit ribosomal protein S1
MSGDVMGDLFLEAMKKEEESKSEASPRGTLRKGKIVAINNKDVFLDLGSKAECVVPLTEFAQPPKIGEMVDIVLKDMLDGVNIGSKLEAAKISRSNDIKEAWENGLPVSGTLEEPVYKDGSPKGYTVDLGFNIKAFMPLSQMDIKKDEKLENLKGSVQDLAIIEMRRNNITVSRREFLFKTIKKLYVSFFEKHKTGDIVHGKAERIEEDYLVLSAEGIRAFMHVSDFSWKFLADLRNIVKSGDEMEASIIRLDPAKNSVKISRKILTPDPWIDIEKKYSVGDILKGKTFLYKKDGVMIEIADGIEAFLPAEEMSWTEKVRDPRKHLPLGSMVEVKIRNMDIARRRMDVSLRDILPNPWENAEKSYPYGKKVEGVITSIVDFGIFVKLEDNIEGLLRKEDVDWMETNVDLRGKFKKDDRIQAIVLSLDKEKGRLRLGLKQLSDNPIKSFSLNYPKGSLVSAVIKETQENGVIVSLENDLEGFIHISQISKDKVEKTSDVLKAGDGVKAIVKSIDTTKNKIELSIKEYLQNEERFESSKYLVNQYESKNTVMMGTILKEQFANINVEKKNADKKSKSE